MQIQAALLTAPHAPFRIETLELAPPRAGEVLVKIAAVGVCHSDWHLVSGATQHPMPVVAGHEGAGIVEAVGKGVHHLKVGDQVVLSWSPDCGECFYCLSGKPNLCSTFTEPIWAGVMLDGTPRLSWNGQPVYHYCGLAAFAEYAVVPMQSCIRIPQEVPPEIAALVGCAVATGVGAALFTSPVKPGEKVVIYGAGGVGLSTVLGASLAGAGEIIVVDTNAAKLALARDFGATQTVLANEDTTTAIHEFTNGRGADQVFEAVGAPAVQEAAFKAVRPGGTLTLIGLAPMGSGTNLPGAEITRKEIVIKGSYYGTVNAHRDFPMMIDLYQHGKLPLERLVSKRYTLPEINEAYAEMLNGSSARGVIVF